MRGYLNGISLAFLAAIALAATAAAADALAPETKPGAAPPAKWVTPQFFDRSWSADQAQPGEDQRILLFERQLNPAENETFTHAIRQILTFEGVQNGSTISVDLGPTYQTLTFHWYTI